MMQDMRLTEIWYVCVCARMLTVVKLWCVLCVIRVYCAVLVQGLLYLNKCITLSVSNVITNMYVYFHTTARCFQ